MDQNYDSAWLIGELVDVKDNISRLLDRIKSSRLPCSALQSALVDARWAAARDCDEAISMARREAGVYA